VDETRSQSEGFKGRLVRGEEAPIRRLIAGRVEDRRRPLRLVREDTPARVVNAAVRREAARAYADVAAKAAPVSVNKPAATSRDATPADVTDRMASFGQAIADHADPRWVLAVRTSVEMQGSLLAPERREKLVDLGCRMGLSPFDANLVIAIVQDQARRGFAPEHCPTAGEAQLRMVPKPQDMPITLTGNRKQALTTAWLLIAFIAFELFLLWGVFLR
jgi:hypothetical protein